MSSFIHEPLWVASNLISDLQSSTLVRGFIRLPCQPVPQICRVQILEVCKCRELFQLGARHSDATSYFNQCRHRVAVASLTPSEAQRSPIHDVRRRLLQPHSTPQSSFRPDHLAYAELPLINREDLDLFPGPLPGRSLRRIYPLRDP